MILKIDEVDFEFVCRVLSRAKAEFKERMPLHERRRNKLPVLRVPVHHYGLFGRCHFAITPFPELKSYHIAMKDEIINDILRDMEEDAEAAWEGTSLRRALVKYATRLRKALAAPARNCDRFKTAGEAHRAKECEQCIRNRVRDEEMKTRAEQMSPAEETDCTLLEMRRAATNGRMVIKENPIVRSSLECYVDNTLAYANRLADSIARERRRAATKLSLAELHIKTLQKQFKHHEGGAE